MLLRVRGVECVPFAVRNWSFAGLRLNSFSSRGLQLQADFPVALIDSPTLRLHELRYDFSSIRDVTAKTPPAELALRYLQSLCSPWDKTTRAFLNAYFHEIAAGLDDAGPDFAAKVARFAGLYRTGDWLFSAPAPLPQAHLFAPASGVEADASEKDFVLVDLAFRVGGRFFALISDASSATPKAAREMRERLVRQGVTVLALHAGAEAADARDVSGQLLVAEGQAFWRADAVPRGISAPAVLVS